MSAESLQCSARISSNYSRVAVSNEIRPVSATMATSDNQNETQSRLYFLNEQLQKMVKELPRKYQQRIPNELLCELAECLLDKTLYSIVKELTDIQHVTEKQMFQKRLEMINKHSGKYAVASSEAYTSTIGRGRQHNIASEFLKK